MATSDLIGQTITDLNLLSMKPICHGNGWTGLRSWLASQKREFCAVVESGRVIGEINKSQLIAAMYRGLGRSPVGQLLVS